MQLSELCHNQTTVIEFQIKNDSFEKKKQKTKQLADCEYHRILFKEK